MNQHNNNSDMARQKYATARVNLLLLVAFTLLNIIMLVVGSDYFLMFSATVPYFAVLLGMIDETGMMLIPCVAIAVIGLISYFLCWLLSKKNYGWMVAALVLFVVDTLALVGVYILVGDFSGIMDLLFHAWVLYYLLVGVTYGKQLQNMPEEEPEVLMDQPQVIRQEIPEAEQTQDVQEPANTEN